MKKLLFLLLFLDAIAPVVAQTTNIVKSTSSNEIQNSMQKGRLFLGLNGTGGVGRGAASTTDTWSGTGQIGYFVAHRWVTGLQFTYGTYRNVNSLAATSSFYPPPLMKRNERNFTPEIFTRYYVTNWKVKPFLQASAGWNFASGKYTQVNGETTGVDGNNFAAKAALGASFRLGRRASIDLLYSRSLTKFSNFGDGSGLRLGVSFLVK